MTPSKQRRNALWRKRLPGRTIKNKNKNKTSRNFFFMKKKVPPGRTEGISSWKMPHTIGWWRFFRRRNTRQRKKGVSTMNWGVALFLKEKRLMQTCRGKLMRVTYLNTGWGAAGQYRTQQRFAVCYKKREEDEEKNGKTKGKGRVEKDKREEISATTLYIYSLQRSVSEEKVRMKSFWQIGSNRYYMARTARKWS